MLEMKMRYLCDMDSQKRTRSNRICKCLWVKHVLSKWKTSQRKLFELREMHTFTHQCETIQRNVCEHLQSVRFQRWTCKQQQNEVNFKLLWLFFPSSLHVLWISWDTPFLHILWSLWNIENSTTKPIWANNKNDFVQIVSMSIRQCIHFHLLKWTIHLHLVRQEKESVSSSPSYVYFVRWIALSNIN